jgi:two-component system chemotaxis response regulator CheY
MKRRLLVVDDSPSVRTIIKVYLALEPFDIAEAGDVPRALTLTAIQKPDAILADFNMPGKSGLDLFRELRAKGMNQVALLMLTASKEVGLVERATQAGADACLTKPIDPKALKDALQLALFKRSRKPAP